MADVVTPFDEVRAAVGRHVPALDGLRGLAILLVLVHNAAGPEGPSPGAAMKVFDVATNIGWVGVQLFFVLSGFLITGILLDTKGRARAWRSFFMRRVLRIFPLYYAALVVAFVVAPLVRGTPAVAAPYVGFYLAYLQNWSSAVVVHGKSGALGHFWSLAVEEQFYVVWPLVVFLLPRRALAVVAALLVVAAPAVRVAILSLGWSNEWAYQGTLARMDALALGGLGVLALRTPAAYAWIAPRIRKATWALGAALAVVVVAARGFPRQNDVSQTVGYSVLALFFLALLISAVLGARAGFAAVSRPRVEAAPRARPVQLRPLRVPRAHLRRAARAVRPRVGQHGAPHDRAARVRRRRHRAELRRRARLVSPVREAAARAQALLHTGGTHERIYRTRARSRRRERRRARRSADGRARRGTPRSRARIAVYFGPAARPLFGMIHAPEGGFGGARVLLCPPLGYEAQFAYVTFSDLAVSVAAAANAVVMTFDYDGTGDSAGTDEDPDPIGRVTASVHAAIEHLKAIPGPPGPVILVGLRAGALVAAYAASTRGDVAAIALWAPLSGHAFLREHRVFSQLSDTNPPPPRGRERDLGARGFEANGCVFTDEAIEALEPMDLKKLGKAPAPRVLVLHRADMPSWRTPPAAWSAAEVEEQSAPGYSEMMDPPWLWIPPRIATRVIAEWVHRVAAPHVPSSGALAPLRIAPDDAGVMPDGSEERAVWFRPARPAVRHLDDARGSEADGTVALLVSSVFSYRIGPNRSNVYPARRLAALGIASRSASTWTGVGDSREHVARPPAQPYDAAAVETTRCTLIEHLRRMGFGADHRGRHLRRRVRVLARRRARAGGALNVILINIGQFDPAPYTREHHTEWRAGVPASMLKPPPEAPLSAKARWILRRAGNALKIGKTLAPREHAVALAARGAAGSPLRPRPSRRARRPRVQPRRRRAHALQALDLVPPRAPHVERDGRRARHPRAGPLVHAALGGVHAARRRDEGHRDLVALTSGAVITAGAGQTVASPLRRRWSRSRRARGPLKTVRRESSAALRPRAAPRRP